jgi:hypothetical protein
LKHKAFYNSPICLPCEALVFTLLPEALWASGKRVKTKASQGRQIGVKLKMLGNG